MKYNLLLTRYNRVRWLWWGVPLYVVGSGGLLALHVEQAIGALGALVAGLLVLLFAYDKLFRQSAWVLVEAEELAWANPASDPPVRLPFAEVRAYRFELYRQGMKFFLYLRNGEKITLDGRFDLEFAALEQRFMQAVQQYNQAHPDAPVRQEKTFFERPISSKILLGLLAASAGWVAWSMSQQATAVAYFPVVLVLVPYLGVWAGYSSRRE